MRFAVEHTTTYRYAEPVSVCHNLAHLLPRDTDRQRCTRAALAVAPRPSRSIVRQDYFGNRASYFSIEQNHRALTVVASSEVETEEGKSLDLDLGITCGEARSALAEPAQEATLLAREFCLNSPLVARSPWLAQYAEPCFDDDRPLLGAVRELVARVHGDFTYEPDFTTVSTPLSEVIAHRRGVCQDFAHLAIGCLRSLGFSARYVSGYIETAGSGRDDGPDGPAGTGFVGADASHAWLAVYAPGEGWCDFDPTNDQLVAEQHITAAWGRDFSDVTPLRGIVFGGGAEQALSVSVSVRRL